VLGAVSVVVLLVLAAAGLWLPSSALVESLVAGIS
jgi:hypothetical protein